MFLIDSSGSIRDSNIPGEPDNWNVMLRFIHDIVGDLDVGRNRNHVAAVTFSNKAKIEFSLQQYSTKAEVQAAIKNIEYMGGNTNTTGGLRLTRQHVLRTAENRPKVKDIIILVTDGKTTREQERLYDEACALKGPGVLIMGVGITNQVDVTELRGVVSSPWTEYYHIVNDFSGLRNKLRRIVNDFCVMAAAASTSLETSIGLARQGDVDIFFSGDWAAIPNPAGPNPVSCVNLRQSDSSAGVDPNARRPNEPAQLSSS